MLMAAIMLVGFLQVCNSAALMLQNIKYRMKAVNIAQAELEDLRALGWANIDVSEYTPYKSTNVTIDDGLTAAPEDDIAGEMRTVIKEATSGPANGLKIVITVSWNILDRPRNEILEAVIYDPR